MPRRAGGKRRKHRTHSVPAPGTSVTKVPRTLVFRRGKIPTAVRDLIPDVRRMLMPNTALNLKERKFNNIRDYVSVSSQLGVSHFWMLSATARGPYLRFAKTPQGPTLSFRVTEYSLAADVRAAQRRPFSLQDGDFAHAPLLVLNGFGGKGGSVELMAEMFRKSFPAVNVKDAKLRDMRRVVLVDRDEDEDVVRIRHFAVRVQPAGLSKSVRKITVRGKVPKLAKMTDVSELVDGEGGAATGAFSSDSEMDDTQMPVTLSQSVRKMRSGASSSVKLVEVGPRLSLQLIKAQGGMCDGAVLYHRHVVKDEDENKAAERRIAARNTLKRKRREEQEANVEKKTLVKEAKKARYRERKALREENDRVNISSSDDGDDEMSEKAADDADSDSDSASVSGEESD